MVWMYFTTSSRFGIELVNEEWAARDVQRFGTDDGIIYFFANLTTED